MCCLRACRTAGDDATQAAGLRRALHLREALPVAHDARDRQRGGARDGRPEPAAAHPLAALGERAPTGGAAARRARRRARRARERHHLYALVANALEGIGIIEDGLRELPRLNLWSGSGLTE